MFVAEVCEDHPESVTSGSDGGTGRQEYCGELSGGHGSGHSNGEQAIIIGQAKKVL